MRSRNALTAAVAFSAALLTGWAEQSPGIGGVAAAQGNDREIREDQAYREGFRDGQRYALERGQRISSGEYRVLDPDLYRDVYGRRLDEGYRYVETDEGTRLLIQIATGIIAEILGEAPAQRVPRDKPRRQQVDIPPGHYPPPGSCRVWYPDRPPGHQPPPGACDVRVPRGAVLVEG